MANSCGDGRITLAPLRTDQYRQVAEWDHGPQGDVDWERYAAEMDEQRWTHYGIYADGEFAGCLSLEEIDHDTIEYHVATARRKIHPRRLANLLLNTATYLFNYGYTFLRARIPTSNRAAARLAIRCGMIETIRNDAIREFILTRPLITPARPERQNGYHEAETL